MSDKAGDACINWRRALARGPNAGGFSTMARKHADHAYHLRITHHDKLILTKQS